MTKKLYRSRKSSVIAGVCGGIAEYLDKDPTIIRLIALALLFISSGTLIIPYIIAAFIMPVAPKEFVEEFNKYSAQDVKQEDVIDVVDVKEANDDDKETL